MTLLLCAGPLRQNQQGVRTQFGGDDRSDLFGAVSKARTLVAHHPEVFGAGEREEEGEEEGGVPGLLAVVVSLVANAVSDTCSALQMNGLMCMAELFRCVLLLDLAHGVRLASGLG